MSLPPGKYPEQLLHPKLQNPIPLPFQPFHPLIIPIIQILGRQPIILLIDIKRLPPLNSLQPQLFIFIQHLHFAVVALVAESCRGGKEEGAGDHGGDEGEAEEEEGVAG